MIFFVILEILLRMLGLGNPLLYQADSYVEYLARPNQNIHRFGKNVSTDHLGLRSSDPCRSMASVKSSKYSKVMILGDSVMFGGLVDDNKLASNSFCRSSKDLVVANVSAGSWGPGNWLGWLESRGFLNADYLLIVVSSSDAFDKPHFHALNLNTNPVKKPYTAFSELFFRYFPRILDSSLREILLSLQEDLINLDASSKRLAIKKL